jgi:hypothetical protein
LFAVVSRLRASWDGSQTAQPIRKTTRRGVLITPEGLGNPTCKEVNSPCPPLSNSSPAQGSTPRSKPSCETSPPVSAATAGAPTTPPTTPPHTELTADEGIELGVRDAFTRATGTIPVYSSDRDDLITAALSAFAPALAVVVVAFAVAVGITVAGRGRARHGHRRTEVVIRERGADEPQPR